MNEHVKVAAILHHPRDDLLIHFERNEGSPLRRNGWSEWNERRLEHAQSALIEIAFAYVLAGIKLLQERSAESECVVHSRAAIVVMRLEHDVHMEGAEGWEGAIAPL